MLLLDRSIKTIDNRDCRIGIILDFFKALDTVDPSRLLSKSNHHGIRCIAFYRFASYLDNRKQSVSYYSVKYIIYNRLESKTYHMLFTTKMRALDGLKLTLMAKLLMILDTLSFWSIHQQ